MTSEPKRAALRREPCRQAAPHENTSRSAKMPATLPADRSRDQPPGWGQAFDQLMPMHLSLTPEGIITRVGPTLHKILQVTQPEHLHAFSDAQHIPFATVFDLSRPRVMPGENIGGLPNGTALALNLVSPKPLPDITLKGGLASLGTHRLLNLSFGPQLAEAVTAFALTAEDFAPTDPAPEMLFLMEAKSAAVEASQRLSRRLRSARIAAEAEAQTDTLTGAKNRRAMERELTFLCKSGAVFAVIHLDLDHFKQVNDTRGHLAGDHVLRVATERLSAQLRQSDLLVRYGGDEFVLILRGETDKAKLRAVSDRLIQVLEAPVLYQTHVCKISASVGISRSVDYATPEPQQMLANADAALYISKRAGRGCAHFYECAPD